MPVPAKNEVLIEYTAHPEACFHLRSGQVIPVARVESSDQRKDEFLPVPRCTQPVQTARGGDAAADRSVPVKLHIHGEWGEYLAPVDRHRILNPAWFEDYSADFLHVDRPTGHMRTPAPISMAKPPSSCRWAKCYLEISKGFEIRPLRKVVEVTPATAEIVIETGKGAALARERLGDRRYARPFPFPCHRACWKVPPRGSTWSTCSPASGAS